MIVNRIRFLMGGINMANVFQQTHCPICGEKVAESDEWTITVDEEMNPQKLFHKKCYEDKMKSDNT